MRGRFLVFEGPDGSGKSTQVEEARRHLEARGIPCITVRDPGGTAIGDGIRAILLNPAHTAMAPATELLLYAASRAQLVHEQIRPALDAGTTVISDRFHYSTLAYQGVHGSIPEEMLRTVIHCGVDPLEPDYVFFLDLPAMAGLQRIAREKDRMEEKGPFFLEEVRQRYLGIFDGMAEERSGIVDANRPILEVTQDVLERLDDLFS